MENKEAVSSEDQETSKESFEAKQYKERVRSRIAGLVPRHPDAWPGCPRCKGKVMVNGGKRSGPSELRAVCPQCGFSVGPVASLRLLQALWGTVCYFLANGQRGTSGKPAVSQDDTTSDKAPPDPAIAQYPATAGSCDPLPDPTTGEIKVDPKAGQLPEPEAKPETPKKKDKKKQGGDKLNAAPAV